MGPTELLYWLSAKKIGSWGQFRSAVEGLLEEAADTDSFGERVPLHQRVRFSLEQLGHVEFHVAGDKVGWRVAPPALATTEIQGESVATLCGARLPELVSMLCEERRGVEVERHATTSNEAPEILRFVAKDNNELQMVAAQTGISFQPLTSLSILASLPRITDLGAWRCPSAQIPFGRDTKIQQFKLSRRYCGWSDSINREAKARDGLYRITRFQRREHYLRVNGFTYRVPGQFGNYFIAAQRRRPLMQYDRNRHQVHVADICRPPLLVDRALILCTGFLPAHDPINRTLTYSDVPENIAGLAAFVLCQERI